MRPRRFSPERLATRSATWRPPPRARDDERELLAADPEDLLVGADDPHQDAAHGAQDLVPGEMPLLSR